MDEMAGGTVVFVCLHGANKSRLAAAFFNAIAPTGWQAVSAGLDPQPAVSEHAVGLAAGTDAEALLDHLPPRGLQDLPADRVVAVDCDVPGAVRWDLAEQAVGEAMRDELRARAQEFAREVANAHR